MSSMNFLISIQKTENYTLQGWIEWLESGEKLHFRSELEMMNLMTQVLNGNKHIESFRTWSSINALNVKAI